MLFIIKSKKSSERAFFFIKKRRNRRKGFYGSEKFNKKRKEEWKRMFTSKWILITWFVRQSHSIKPHSSTKSPNNYYAHWKLNLKDFAIFPPSLPGPASIIGFLFPRNCTLCTPDFLKYVVLLTKAQKTVNNFL